MANHPPTDLKTVSFRCHNRSSARRPCLQVLQSHLRVAKQSSIGPSARPPRPEVSQSHPRVTKRSSSRSSARRPRLQVPQRHPVVAKGASIGTLARRPCPQVPQGHPRVAKGVFRPIFGTATPSRGTSETSPRGEEGFYRHFGTATLPTDASVASSRSHCELVYRIVAVLAS